MLLLVREMCLCIYKHSYDHISIYICVCGDIYMIIQVNIHQPNNNLLSRSLSYLHCHTLSSPSYSCYFMHSKKKSSLLAPLFILLRLFRTFKEKCSLLALLLIFEGINRSFNFLHDSLEFLNN